MSWYSNIASRVNNSVSNLQRTVFNSEADGDTQDDTYVCRVLRQYYTEKGTGFPQWLPPDPKAPPPVVVSQTGPANSRYGNLQTSQSVGGLSSLWDKNRAAGGASAPPAVGGVSSRNPFAQRGAVSPEPGAAGVQARPLPSQRAGSYQAAGAGAGAAAAGVGLPGGSIQDRLRSKLGSGARTVSPGSASSPFAPPPPQGGNGAGSGDYDPYKAGSYGGGGGYGDAGAGAPAGRYGGVGLPSGPRRMGGLPSGPKMR